MASPFVGLNSGTMDLIYADGSLTKTRLLQCFVDMTKAAYLKLDVFNRVSVKAVVLLPGGVVGNTANKGHLSLSGENMPVEAVGIEVHPGVMRVCVPAHLNQSEWMRQFEL